MNELALFAGAGGGLLASKLLGWSTVCAVELEPYARKVLLQRQADGHLERFPIWDDVSTFDGNPWRGSVNVISGGFPCQDISSAGKGGGIAGQSSGLVWEMLRIAGEVRPRFIFAENSPRLRTAGLGSIIRTLDGMGYDCAWGVLGAWHAGAPHRRDRLWLLAADASGKQHQGGAPEERRQAAEVISANANSSAVRQQRKRPKGNGAEASEPIRSEWWATESEVDRVAHGVAGRMGQLRAIGNGQVPAVAALAFNVLRETLGA